MPAHNHSFEKIPLWSWATPGLGALLLIVKHGGMVQSGTALFLVPAVLLMGGAIFAAVHHAEVLAVKVGEPFGSVLLALAITIMEVAVILSVMVAGTEGSD